MARPLTPIMKAALEAMKAETRKMREKRNRGVRARYPDRRRERRSHAVLHISHRTLVALERRGLMYRWTEYTYRGGSRRQDCTRWRVR